MKEPETLRVMVVDSDNSRRSGLTRALRSAGCQVSEFAEGEAALTVLAENGHDVVIANAGSPGIEFLRALAARGVEAPVIMVAPADSSGTVVECLKAGAMDCIAWPLHPDYLLARIARAIQRRELLDDRQRYQQQAEARLVQSAHDERRLFLAAVESLASALEARDPCTRGHSARVADISIALALALGLPEKEREQLRVAAVLHDIGKIGIPDHVLKKPGRLTRSERAQIQMHPMIAVRILSPVLADAQTVSIIQHHHERLDGTGYPDGLAGNDIPVGARILAAADAFDAMTSERSYRPAYNRTRALDEMRAHAGTQLDTDVVHAFHMMLRRRENGPEDERAKDARQNREASSLDQPQGSTDAQVG